MYVHNSSRCLQMRETRTIGVWLHFLWLHGNLREAIQNFLRLSTRLWMSKCHWQRWQKKFDSIAALTLSVAINSRYLYDAIFLQQSQTVKRITVLPPSAVTKISCKCLYQRTPSEQKILECSAMSFQGIFLSSRSTICVRNIVPPKPLWCQPWNLRGYHFPYDETAHYYVVPIFRCSMESEYTGGAVTQGTNYGNKPRFLKSQLGRGCGCVYIQCPTMPPYGRALWGSWYLSSIFFHFIPRH